MSLNDITYTILLQEIVCFRIPPGSWINENAVAKQLGISRSPMKYALSRLEKEGYVKKSHKYSVTGFSIKEYTDLKELCFLLESYAAWNRTPPAGPPSSRRIGSWKNCAAWPAK